MASLKNAPLHLFSAAPDLVEFGGTSYQRRSEQTSRLLGQLIDKLRGEGLAVSYTMEDFNRQYVMEHFARLTPAERRKALSALPTEDRREVLRSLPPDEQEELARSLPPERRLAGLSEEQIRQYLDRLHAGRSAAPRRRAGAGRRSDRERRPGQEDSLLARHQSIARKRSIAALGPKSSNSKKRPRMTS